MLKYRIEDSFTFDDVLFFPWYYKVQPGEVSVKSKITKTLECNISLLSATMDTVTKHQTAICRSQDVEIGIIHKNKNVKEPPSQVNVVKRSESSRISGPNYRWTVITAAKCIELDARIP